MQIIKTHDITLYGGNDKYSIVLLPLADEHLPYLYKWNSDPEVLYWTEGGEDVPMSYSPETVHQIYGGISQNNLCFAIEVNGKLIGECWLQKMNLPNIKAMYDESLDVRRIDMAIGEKDYWGKGIGTLFIKMLVDFAFEKENVDILHCFCDDYNIRSRRVWEKNGFELILTEELPQPQKGKLEYHWRLTREKYINCERKTIIRKARSTDANQLKTLYFEHLTLYPPQEEQNIGLWAEMLSRFCKDKNMYLLVAEENGVVVSSIQMAVIESLTHNVRPFAVIENVVTHFEYRNKGYASALLETATSIVRARNCYKISLETGSNKESTLNFYRKNGFVIDAKHSCLKRL